MTDALLANQMPKHLNASYEGDDLFTGDQLRAAVAAEREACAKLVRQTNSRKRRENMTKYVGDLADSLTEELMEVIRRYDETMIVATVIGCIELVKQQIITNHIEEDDDD
jgi:hypothetical protein